MLQVRSKWILGWLVCRSRRSDVFFRHLCYRAPSTHWIWSSHLQFWRCILLQFSPIHPKKVFLVKERIKNLSRHRQLSSFSWNLILKINAFYSKIWIFLSMNARNIVKLVNFVYCVYVGCCSQVDVFGQGGCNDFVCCCTHNLLQSCIDNILFSSSFKQRFSIEFGLLDTRCLLNDV